jgi:hypothetical protein
LTISSFEGFARADFTSYPSISAFFDDNMASTQSTKTAETLAWKNGAVPLTLIIPTFNLPTASTVEAATAAPVPAPTQLEPTIPVEGSGNVAWSSTTRWLTVCYLLLLAVKMIDESL